MTSLSIPGMPLAGNSSFSLCVVPGPWRALSGLRQLGVVCFGGAGLHAPLPSRGRPTPCHSPCRPQAVLTSSWCLLRPRLRTRRAAPAGADDTRGEGCRPECGRAVVTLAVMAWCLLRSPISPMIAQGTACAGPRRRPAACPRGRRAANDPAPLRPGERR